MTDLKELTDTTVRAIKAEAELRGGDMDWYLIWILVGNALAESYRQGGQSK